VLILLARQPRQLLEEQCRIFGSEPAGGDDASQGWYDAIDLREPTVLVDGEMKRPRPDAHTEVRRCATDRYRSVPWQLRAAEDHDGRHEHIFFPGEVKAPLDQQLPTIRADHLASASTQLHLLQGQADSLPGNRPARLVQGLEEVPLQRHHLLR